MSSLEYDSRASKPALRRPPRVTIEEPGSPGPGSAGPGALMPMQQGPVGALVPMQPPGPMVLAPGVPGGVPGAHALQRLHPQVLHTLSTLAGPPGRLPLVYTGDVEGSLSSLRKDLSETYQALCSVLGELPRTDLLSERLPYAASLGLHLPYPASSVARLPPIGASSGSAGAAIAAAAAPLMLQPPPNPALASAAPGAGAVAMGLGDGMGVEGVGSGADAPSSLLGGGLFAAPGALRSLSAGHNPYALVPFAGGPRPGLNALAFPQAAAVQRQWPMGHPGGAGPVQGPRLTALSGWSRPRDAQSDFVGEEGALVYPPAGRDFAGGPSAVARRASGPQGFGAGIDTLEDLRFRSGPKKHIRIEQLDNLTGAVPASKRHDGPQLDDYLKEYAREQAPRPPALPGTDKYRMPF